MKQPTFCELTVHKQHTVEE